MLVDDPAETTSLSYFHWVEILRKLTESYRLGSRLRWQSSIPGVDLNFFKNGSKQVPSTPSAPIPVDHVEVVRLNPGTSR